MGVERNKMQAKILLIPVLAIGLAAGGFAIGKVWASNSANNQHNMSSQLAQKLGVDESKVSTAMTEIQDEQKLQELKDSLQKAVDAGVITQEQMQSVIDKQNEIEQKQNALLEEFKTWASQNNIDYDKLQSYLHTGKGMGDRGGMMPNGEKPTDMPQNPPTATNESVSSN